MKGDESAGFTLIIVFVAAIVVLAIVLAVLSSQTSGIPWYLELGCNVCDMVIGNLVSGLTFHIINPCEFTFCTNNTASSASSGVTTTTEAGLLW